MSLFCDRFTTHLNVFLDFGHVHTCQVTRLLNSARVLCHPLLNSLVVAHFPQELWELFIAASERHVQRVKFKEAVSGPTLRILERLVPALPNNHIFEH